MQPMRVALFALTAGAELHRTARDGAEEVTHRTARGGNGSQQLVVASNGVLSPVRRHDEEGNEGLVEVETVMSSLESGSVCQQYANYGSWPEGVCVPFMEAAQECLAGPVLASGGMSQMIAARGCGTAATTKKDKMPDYWTCCGTDSDVKTETWRGDSRPPTAILEYPDPGALTWNYDGNDAAAHSKQVPMRIMTMPLENSVQLVKGDVRTWGADGRQTGSSAGAAMLTAVDCFPDESSVGIPDACLRHEWDGFGLADRGSVETDYLVRERGAMSRIVAASFTALGADSKDTVQSLEGHWPQSGRTVQIGRDKDQPVIEPAEPLELQAGLMHQARAHMEMALLGTGRNIKYTTVAFRLQRDKDSRPGMEKYSERTGFFEFDMDPVLGDDDPAATGRWVLVLWKSDKDQQRINLRDITFDPTADVTARQVSIRQSRNWANNWAQLKALGWPERHKRYTFADASEDSAVFLHIEDGLHDLFCRTLQAVLAVEQRRYAAGMAEGSAVKVAKDQLAAAQGRDAAGELAEPLRAIRERHALEKSAMAEQHATALSTALEEYDAATTEQSEAAAAKAEKGRVKGRESLAKTTSAAHTKAVGVQTQAHAQELEASTQVKAQEIQQAIEVSQTQFNHAVFATL